MSFVKGKTDMTKKEFDSRISSIEKRLDEHIHDGIGVWQGLEEVKTDITWIKRAMWVLVSLGVSFNGIVVKYVISHLK